MVADIERRPGVLNLNLQQMDVGANSRSKGVPPEYADDPDLYWAIQESMKDPEDDFNFA